MSPSLMAVISICISVAAQFSLKAGMSSPSVRAALQNKSDFLTTVSALVQPYVIGGFILYGLGAVLWLGVLSQWEVSKAYPIVGLGFVLTAGVGFLAGENVTLMRAGGVLLICLGVLVVSKT